MGKRGPKPKGKIKIKWSSNFAYAIGLLATDGCLSRDGRHITLVSKDIDQLKNFCNSLKITCYIGKYKSGMGRYAYRIQLTDTLFHAYLMSIDLTPAKSITMGNLKIPDRYFFDFLRGCFDGDGCSYSYWDQRWKSSFMFYIAFSSGSAKFIAWLRSTITKLSKLNGHVSFLRRNEKRKDHYQLRYSKYEAIKLVRLMYRNRKCIKLTRKYLKIRDSLDIVRTHKGKVFVR